MQKFGKIVLIDSTMSRPTYNVHWFPASDEKGGTMYAENGPLHKYDLAFNTNSRSFEMLHNRRSSDWEGHCDKAATVISLFREPVKDVIVNGIKFTSYDIKGLLIKVVHNFPILREWVGNRYPEEHAGEPSPKEVYEKLKQWTHLKIPVILDVDAYLPVWMFAYDKVVFDFDKNFMEVTSTGQSEENRKYKFDWGSNTWLGEMNIGGKSKNPDIAWIIQTSIDLYNRDNWPLENGKDLEAFLNPNISPKNVFDIYIQSINT